MSTCNIVAVLVAVLVSSCGFLERGLADEVGATHLCTAVLIRDASGLGDFEKIQDAVDAVPFNNTRHHFIWVKPGTYRCDFHHDLIISILQTLMLLSVIFEQ